MVMFIGNETRIGKRKTVTLKDENHYRQTKRAS